MSELQNQLDSLLESGEDIQTPFSGPDADKSRLQLGLEKLPSAAANVAADAAEKMKEANRRQSRVGYPSRRDPRIPLTDKQKSEQAMFKHHGIFSDKTDPTGMIQTGDPAETARLAEAETARLLEQFSSPKSLLDRLDDIRPPEPKTEDLSMMDRAIIGVKSVGLGFQKSPAFNSGVPIKTTKDGVPILPPTKLDEHAGLVGVIEEFVNLAGIALNEGIKGGAGVLNIPAYDFLRDMGNLSSYLLTRQDRAKDPTVYSKFHFIAGQQGADEVLDVISEYIEKGARLVVPNIRDNETFKQFYYSVRNPISVDPEHRNAITTGLAIFGLFAPLGGVSAGVNTGRLLMKHGKSAIYGSRLALKMRNLNLYENLLYDKKNKYLFGNIFDSESTFRQIYNLNTSKQTFPALNDEKYRILKDDVIFKEWVEKFEKAGLAPEKARKKALNRRRDFVSGVSAGILYSAFDQIQDSEGVSMAASIFGALTGNSITGYGRLVSSKTRFAFDGLLAKFNSTSRANRELAIEAFKNSDSQSMNMYRKTFLRMNGLSNSDIKEAARESLEMGNAAMKTIREAEKNGFAELGGIRYTPQQLRDRYISDGVLNNKGKVHQFYLINTLLDSKFSRNTLEFGAEFNKRVLTGEDGDTFRLQMQQMHSLVDELHSIAPKAMEKFPLLLEQITGFAALQAMRNSLMNQVEFSAFAGRVINGRYLSEAERYHDLLASQSTALQNVVKELRNSDATESEVLSDFLDVLSDGIAKKDLGYKADRVVELKQMSRNDINERTLAAEKSTDEMLALSQFNQVADIVAQARHANAQKQLLQQGFRDAQKRASAPYEALKTDERFKGLELNIAPFLEKAGPEFLEGEAKSIEKLLNFTGLSREQRIEIKRDIAQNYLEKTLPISQREMLKNPSEAFYEGEFVSAIGNIVEVSFQGSAEQKQQILNSLFGNANNLVEQGRIKDAVDLVLENVGNVVDLPAPVGVETFMKIRQTMGQNQRTAYNQNNWENYREISDRIDQLDASINEQSILGGQFLEAYGEARKINKDEFYMYRDLSSPFSQFDNVNAQGRQPVSPHRLFEMFHKGEGAGKDFERNAREFDKVFYDPKVGKYKTFDLLDENGNAVLDSAGNTISINPVEELIYSFATRVTNNFEDLNPAAIDEILADSLLVYSDVFKKAGPKYETFLETLKVYAQNSSAKARADSVDRQVAADAIFEVLNNMQGAYLQAFRESAVSKLGGTEGLDEYGEIIRQSLKSMEDYQTQLLLRGGRSVDFNNAEYFNNMIRKSDFYIKATNRQRKIIEDIVTDDAFQTNLSKISNESGLGGGRRAIEIALDDAHKKVDAGQMSLEELQRLKDSALILVTDNFNKNVFSFVQKSTTDYTVQTKQAMEEIAAEYGISTLSVQRGLRAGDVRQIGSKEEGTYREVTIRDLLREKGVDVARGGGISGKGGYRINLNNEFDPVSANQWWADNKEVYEIIHRGRDGELTEEGKKHIRALDILIQTGTRLTTMGLTQSVKGVPTPYSTQMLLGRVYNAVGKKVVSPTYIGMENIIVNYRVLQGEIVKDILTNPKTADVFANIYAKGLFRPRDARDVIRDFAVRVVQFGAKMTLSQQDALMDLFKDESEETKQKLNQAKNNM